MFALDGLWIVPFAILLIGCLTVVSLDEGDEYVSELLSDNGKPAVATADNIIDLNSYLEKRRLKARAVLLKLLL